MKGLHGKVAIVTGGASGIGLATSVALAERQVTVVMADIAVEAGEIAQRRLASLGATGLFVEADVSDEAEIATLMTTAANEFGRIDILVDCAASFVARSVEKATPEDWRQAFDTNVFGYALCAKHAVPHMREQGGGAIVHVSSISALIAQPARVTYSAGKGALEALTRCMALDLAPDGIRVNAVCPGTIWTPPNENFIRRTMGLDRAGADAHPDLGGRTLLRRTGDAEEVAEAITFLASASASFITGASLVVDGGEIAW